MDIFFIILEFCVTCACPENRVALEFFTALNILFTFRIFEQLALALKNRGCPEFTLLNVDFLLYKIFEQLALALKNRVALEFFAVLKYILLFRIFEELAVALKTEFALKFFKPGGAATLPATPPRTPMIMVMEQFANYSFGEMTIRGYEQFRNNCT